MTEKAYNRGLMILRLLATYAFVGALVWFSRPRASTVTIGFLVAAVGEATRFWAAGHLLKTQELVTSGPYRYTRNPLYLGRLLILTGLGVACTLPYGANWLVLLLGYAVFFFYYLPRKERVEPARLRDLHGEPFDRYFRAVPALFPRLTPYDGGSTGAWSSDRMLRNREHWMIVGVSAVFLFLLWKAYWPVGP